MDHIDVFASVADYCDNYTPDTNAEVREVFNIKENTSDSEAEGIFVNKKKNQHKRGGTKKKDPKTPPKDRDSDNEAVGSKPRTRSQKKGVSGNQDEPILEAPKKPRTTRKRNNQTDQTITSVEDYMAKQTGRVLAVENAAVPAHNQRGRARRRYMAEQAESAPVIGIIDLAGPKTPPLPPYTLGSKQTICLDSDDECNFSFDTALEPGNNSFDIENEEVLVKIKWGDQFDLVPQRRHQKFIDLIKVLANKKDVDAKDILLNLNDRIIRPDDTLDSINYNIAQFISGRIIDNSGYYVPAKTSKGKDPNMLKIKIQSNAFKKPLEVQMRKDQKFKILYIKCSEELRISYDSIKLSFDGDPLNLMETPNDLELEGGEMIDCRIVK